MDQDLKDCVLFVGNPGTGKSTLLNALVGDIRFKSGVAAGAGITRKFTTIKHNGITYSDTPGLEDIKIREQAAAEINAALKQDGKYRIFFVITEEAGRVRPADVQLIETVLNAIQCEVQPCVIFNKLPEKFLKSSWADPSKRASIITAWNSGKHTILPCNIFAFERKDELEYEDDKLLTLPKDDPFREFVENAPSTHIAASSVKELDIARYDENVAMMQTLITQMQSDRQAMDAKMAELLEKEGNRSIGGFFSTIGRAVDGLVNDVVLPQGGLATALRNL